MPLHVEVYVNSTYLDGIHIGRVSGNVDPNNENTYLVVNGPLPRTQEDWTNGGIQFNHRYGDGALVCIRKAIQALEESDSLG